MASGKRKKGKDADPAEVLSGRVSLSMRELIGLIHRVNPTGETTDPKEKEGRYQAKNALQSLLIRRFSENLVVERPDPENPLLVGLRVRHFDEDACHAMLDELDPEARAWVQRQLDEARFPSSPAAKKYTDPKRCVTGPGNAAPSSVAPSDCDLGESGWAGLMRLSRQALAEYDFDACETSLCQAVKIAAGNPEPVTLLLELYVDHLAAYNKALALTNCLPAGSKSSNPASVFLGLAASRSGNFELALEFIRHQTDPRIAEIYLESGNYFIRNGNWERALVMLKELEGLDQVELKPEMERLSEKIRALHVKSLEPIEQEMLQAWRQEKTDEARTLAERLLAVMPDHKSAQSLLQEMKRRQRAETERRFLQAADDAAARGDSGREVDFLKKAIAAGATTGGLTRRLENAEREDRRRREESAVQKVLHLFNLEDWPAALLQYINLPEPQKARIKEEHPDPRLPWLDRLLSGTVVAKGEKLIDAVLMLNKCREDLESEVGLEKIFRNLEPHARILEPISDFTIILEESRKRLKTARAREAGILLDRCAGLIGSGDTVAARSCLEEIQKTWLGDGDGERYNLIRLELAGREVEQKLRQSYQEAVRRKDHLSARNLAGDLARLADPKTAETWIDLLEGHESAIVQEFRLSSINIDCLPGYYACLGLNPLSDGAPACLLPGNRHLVIVTSHERWIFLRFFRLESQSFDRVIILQAPEVMAVSRISLVGRALWIVGDKGNVLELGLEPLTILSWYSSGNFVREEDLLDDVLVCPRSRSIWLSRRKRNTIAVEATEVFDLDRQRVSRLIKSSGFPCEMIAEGASRVLIQEWNSSTLSLYTEQGKLIERFALGNSMVVHVGVFHPNGRDYVFLPFSEGGDDEPRDGGMTSDSDFLLQLTVMPDPQKKYFPFLIEDSHGEYTHAMHTSFDTGLIFVAYSVDTGLGSGWALSAFRVAENGFERLFRVPFPRLHVFARDEFSRQVAAITFQGEQPQAVLLSETSPKFHFQEQPLPGKILPGFQADFFPCNQLHGPLGAMLNAYGARLVDCPEKELDELIRVMKAPGGHTVDEIATFSRALRRYGKEEKADEFTDWMRSWYPGNFIFLLDQAEACAKAGKWREAVELLEKIDRGKIPEGSFRHVCHLRGMGLFIAGALPEARDAWLEGLEDSRGNCELDSYVNYVSLCLMSPDERKTQAGPLPATLTLFDSVERLMNSQQWDEAIRLLEKGGNPEYSDLQFSARLAWAYLNIDTPPNDVGRFMKTIALGDFLEAHHCPIPKSRFVFPPFIETWSKARMDNVAERAKLWLDEYHG